MRRERVLTVWSGLFLVVGLWGVHQLHVCRFMLVDRPEISAFPDWQITLRSSFFMGLSLLVIASIACVVVSRWPKLLPAIGVSLACEVASQTFGRSLFKLIGDAGIWGTVVGGYLLERYYGPHAVAQLDQRQVSAFHSEALGLLRTVVNVCLFVIGTLGIAVTSNLISQYFDTPLGQGTAWVHVGTMLYLAAGMMFFIVRPLFVGVVAARKRLSTN